MFFILLYFQKESVNPRNHYTLKTGKKCFSKNKSVLPSNNYGPGENLSEVSSKNFSVLKLNQALLKEWLNCVFWTPHHFITTHPMPGLWQQAVPMQGMLENLKSSWELPDNSGCPGAKCTARPLLPLLHGAISSCDKSQMCDQAFV